MGKSIGTVWIGNWKNYGDGVGITTILLSLSKAHISINMQLWA